MRALVGTVTPMLGRLDRIRGQLLKLGMPFTSHFASHREHRVSLNAALSIGVAFVLAVSCPLWALALTPVVFGIPHILSDLRYTLIRTGLAQRPALWAGPALALLAFALLDCPPAGFAAPAALALASKASSKRRALVIAASLAAAVCFVIEPRASGLILVHGHNLIAIVLWLLWRRRTGRSHWGVLALLVLGSLAISLGFGADPSQQLGPTALGLDFEARHRWLAPNLGADGAARVVVLFAFLQSIHYTVWLRLVPEEDRERNTPRTFRASYRALLSDLGPGLVFGLAAASIGLLVWSTVDLGSANMNYLRFAGFHAHLELCLLAFLWLEGSNRVVETPGRAS